jgi:tetratricopeptide (TPR) repeat protein
MYLPLCGLALLLATVWDLSGKAQMPLLGLVAVIVLGFGILTAQQEGMWKDDLTLFTAVNKISPRNAPIAEDLSRAHVQVALGLDDEDRCDEAMPIFNQAIQQYPKDWFAWAGRGECLYKLNDLRGSKESLERAYALSKEPRVHDEWQMVREKMDGAAPAR